MNSELALNPFFILVYIVILFIFLMHDIIAKQITSSRSKLTLFLFSSSFCSAPWPRWAAVPMGASLCSPPGLCAFLHSPAGGDCEAEKKPASALQNAAQSDVIWAVLSIKGRGHPFVVTRTLSLCYRSAGKEEERDEQSLEGHGRRCSAKKKKILTKAKRENYLPSCPCIRKFSPRQHRKSHKKKRKCKAAPGSGDFFFFCSFGSTKSGP